MNSLWNHWKCSKCHHEWDGERTICDWCGSKGLLLVKASNEYKVRFFGIVRRIVKRLKGD
jgi:rRNA maturation endonuclease Nob1